MSTGRRRGRLPSGDRQEREREVIAAALQELLSGGAAGLTMDRVARRAGASKETLYAWFGGRDGLLARVVEANADASAQSIRAALGVRTHTADSARRHLTAYAQALLTLLTSPASIELNRAAMSSPQLAEQLRAGGRDRAGPLVEDYLRRLNAAGIIDVADPRDAFGVLFGLVVRDTQISVLLGGPRLDRAALCRQADSAVEAFLQLYVPARNRERDQAE